MKPRFCPKCHRRVEIPAMLKSGNVRTTGAIKVGCSWATMVGKKKVPCSGIVRLTQSDLDSFKKPELVEEVV